MNGTADITLREFSRNVSRTLDVCDRKGRVVIRTRKGTQYELRPVVQAEPTVEKPLPTPEQVKEAWKAHFERMAALRKKLGVKPMNKAQWNRLASMIAGE